MTSWHVIIFGTLHQAGAVGVFINDVTLFWTPKTILWSQNWLFPHFYFNQRLSAELNLKNSNFEFDFFFHVHENIMKKKSKMIIFGTLHQAGAMGVFINDVIIYY